jgi:AraC-like DNA-binding protein
MTTAGYRFGRRDAVHFLPFLISIIYLIPFFFLSGYEKILQWDAFEMKDNIPLILNIHSILTVIHIFSYIAYTIYKLAKLQYLLKDNFSFTDQLNLRWFQIVLYVCLLLLLIYGLREGLAREAGFYEFAQYFLPISITLSIYTMGFMAFRQRSILTEIEEISTAYDSNVPTHDVTKTKSEFEKYHKSSLRDDQTTAISNQLDCAMSDEKLFMDEDLSLPKLAQRIGTSSHHLSQVINSRHKQSFYDYVNGLRVTEVTMKLSNPDFAQQNILDIAMAAGFKSKSAFNKSFKKFTGLTPSQYKESIRGSERVRI